MKLNQLGSAVLYILLVPILAFVAIGAFLTFQSKPSGDGSGVPASDSSATSQGNPDKSEIARPTDLASEFLVITEWGVKLPVSDIDKVSIVVKQESGTLNTGGAYTEVADPSFKTDALQDKKCDPGINLFRSKTVFEGADETSQKKVGDYYYTVAGGPGPCESEADNDLKARFNSEFRIQNLVAI